MAITESDIEIRARDAILSAQAFLTEAMQDTNRWAQTNDDAHHVYLRLRDAKEIVDDLAVAIYTPLTPKGTAGLSEAITETIGQLRDAVTVLEVRRDRSRAAKDALYSVWNAASALTEAHDIWLAMNGLESVSVVEAQPAAGQTVSRETGTGR